ncbi:hypothetical protein COV88_03060 [Candidatus Saccharibacteria bacterium CG11_big_fil_rev_8_21_14_0_20_41_19]|nr:hypothetical protein [Candidatus Saccharibacteria bacterium]OIP85551.1 MAG: hypothetical protein AUK57_03520 [Candidatus Saccharibacteria bacterium CG2_30_41_52]PIQ70713.1 MAG: hypothetical protein COV88_03060 [Candidatus Saccharibacteria bacterium CG11_big_fil_rev_8_21_14_0_20_41_19]PIZ59294.1 MAG: hypothetical protein COY18_03780 [Candidatus Saccharibacteria bacterium CG_4_10_14_0_2_um_filter_41_11]PJC29805.1 MAG: hypothetical protein CO052_01310 [Candidatus Saccharibacteria bacterium CG_4
MPSRSVVNVNVQENYYQLRAEGVGGKIIYNNDADYRHFLTLLEQYILVNDSVQALAYCLAPDHFCLLLNQTNERGIERLMHNIVTAYNKYIDNRYGEEDLLSENNYKVTKISPDELLKVSRDIHTKNADWMDCEYSSIRAYFYDDVPVWLSKQQIAGQYGTAVKYLKFLQAA